MSVSKVLFLLGILVCYASAEQRCRALILQGAGDQGYYQAGALQGLVSSSPDETKYDVISGVGIGAITAGLASQYPVGSEQTMADDIASTWETIGASTWYKNWTFGIVNGLTTQSGFFNTAPAKTFLSEHITQSAQRNVSVGATNAMNAAYVLFNNFNSTNLLAETLQTGVLASYSIGGIFPFVKYNEMFLISGSTLKNIDFASPINECRRLVGSDKLIDIDIILTTGKIWSAGNIAGATSLKMLFTSLSLINFESTAFDLSRAIIEYPEINFRYVIGPSEFLPSGTYPLSYSADQRSSMIELGKNDALNVVNLGAGKNWKEYVDAAKFYLENNSVKYSEIRNMKMSKLLENAYEEENQKLFSQEEILI